MAPTIEPYAVARVPDKTERSEGTNQFADQNESSRIGGFNDANWSNGGCKVTTWNQVCKGANQTKRAKGYKCMLQRC